MGGGGEKNGAKDMGGGGTTQTTQSTSSNSPAVTALTDQLASGVSGLVSRGSSVYGQPLYTGLGSMTTNGVNNLNSQASQGQTGLNNAFNWTNGVVNSGGYNPALQEAQNGIQGYLAESQADAPGFSALRQGVIDDTLSSTNSAFNASGRFGGGANVNQANRGVASAVAGLDYQNYGDRLNRQLTGNQALAGIGQTAMGNAAGAASALPGQFAATLAPAQAQLAAGSILDADALARRQADAQLFDAQNNRGWNDYARASSILAGTAGAAGQTTTNTQPAPSLFQQLLGGGLAIGSAFL